VLEFYKKVLKLRHTNRSLLDGSYTPLHESDKNVFSYLRSYKGGVVLVALNMSASPQKVNFELSKNGFSSAHSLLATPKSAAHGDILTLEPYGVFIGQLSH
jgi:glycosidase